ncbi:hypothetical protein DMR_41400 [Solidesulfovibrio magneticus RS-1]|uniref:Transposase n=1 Tax=Solidesulfovibrio magneticus (strain ATCC 700980 / DSM 13731 / RS-1) TaxID=573370 RepID=C4XPT1_SOLM1|nr:hypothetical protein DMR_41400 [Solidesulfovibrio magneticus RS-1]
MAIITTVGLDLAKRYFQVHGVDKQGKVVLKKQLSREGVLSFFVNLPPCLVGMEACGAHTTGPGRSGSSVTRSGR